MGRRVFEPVAVLPCQVANRPRGPAEGARRLMAALLEDALRCSPQEVRDDSWREAAGWVFSNDRSYVFSFLSVCDALRIDYGWLRMVVRSGSSQKFGRLRPLPERIETEWNAPLR